MGIREDAARHAGAAASSLCPVFQLFYIFADVGLAISATYSAKPET